MITGAASLLASIPSPSSKAIEIGPVSLRAYGLMIALGVVAAVWLTGRRLEQQGIGTREDMSAMGPVKLKDVESAQQEMVVVAKALADRGEIMLADGAGQDELIY